MDNDGDFGQAGAFVGDDEHSGDGISDNKSDRELPPTLEAIRPEPSDDGSVTASKTPPKKEQPPSTPSRSDGLSSPGSDLEPGPAAAQHRSSLSEMLGNEGDRDEERFSSQGDVTRSTCGRKRPRPSPTSTIRPECGSDR